MNTPTIESLAAALSSLEARIDTIVETRVQAALATVTSSEAFTQAVHSHASRTCMSIMGSVGTSPCKASPISEIGTDTQGLIAAKRFEEAWAADPKLRAEFPTAASFAAYARNQHRVRNGK